MRMTHNDMSGIAVGYVHSLNSPGCNTYAIYARFHRELSNGVWIRGSGIEKAFDDELMAVQWLQNLGCADDRIKICRRGLG